MKRSYVRKNIERAKAEGTIFVQLETDGYHLPEGTQSEIVGLMTPAQLDRLLGCFTLIAKQKFEDLPTLEEAWKIIGE